MKNENLERPGDWSGDTAGRRQGSMAQEGMFWKLVPEDVFGKLAEVAEAISMPFGGSHTPRTCMLTSVAAVLHKAHRKWGCEQGNEGLENGRETCASAFG